MTAKKPIAELGNARTAELKGGGRIGVRAPMRETEAPVVRPYVLVDDIAAAVKTAEAAGGQVVYAPDAKTMYPEGYATYVEVKGLQDGLCGKTRPHFFRGVATVVTKLFNAVQPDRAYFGLKDGQQSVIIQRMVKDLDFGIEIVCLPTVREADGLAMSSRNAYLSPEERKAAAVLFRALSAARALIACGERRADAVRATMRDQLATEPLAQVEYAEVVDADTFQPVEKVAGRLVLPLAVRMGATRLIDNIQLTVGD